MSVKTGVIPFIPKQDLHPSDICLYRSEALSDITDTAELYSVITNVYKPRNNFEFPETQLSFKTVCFEEFPWACYPRWEDDTYCLPCVLFDHKVVGNSSLKHLYRRPY